MGVKDVLKKLKPQEQSCCSVEIEEKKEKNEKEQQDNNCLLYTSPSPRD